MVIGFGDRFSVGCVAVANILICHKLLLNDNRQLMTDDY